MYGESYVRRTYNRFRALYWPHADLPDFDTLDFDWSSPNPRAFEWGSVEWDRDGIPQLTLNAYIRLSSSAIKGTLLHEMVHLYLGPTKGHGCDFNRESDRIHKMKAHRHYF